MRNTQGVSLIEILFDWSAIKGGLFVSQALSLLVSSSLNLLVSMLSLWSLQWHLGLYETLFFARQTKVS